MTEQFANNASSPISGAISAIASSLVIGTPAIFPSIGNFRLLVDTEYMLVTSVVGSTFNVTRGIEGSIASPHANGAIASCIVTAGALVQLEADALAASVASIATTGSFVQPVASPSVTVVVSVSATTPILSVGMHVYVQGGGDYLVTALGAGTATLQNLGLSTNSAVGATVPSGSRVITSGTNPDTNVLNIAKFGASPADVGPAVTSALLALQSNLGGSVYLPPNATGSSPFFWVTPTNVTYSSQGTTLQPPATVIRGAGTVVQVEPANPTSGFPTLTIASLSEPIAISDLVFLGDTGRTNDVVQVFSLSNNTPGTVTLSRIIGYGVQGSNGVGVWAVSTGGAYINDCLFLGCAHSNTFGAGGVLHVTATLAVLERLTFYSVGGFGGVTYAKSATDSWIHVDGIDNFITISGCTLDGAFTAASIWLTTQAGRNLNKANIRDCSLNTCSSFGVSPVLLIEGQPAGDVDIETTTFQNLGGHFGPDLIVRANTQISRLRLSHCTIESNVADVGIWPKFKLQLAQSTGGTIQVEDLRNYKPFLFQTQPAGTTLLYDFKLGAPTSLTETYDGVTTQHPVGLAPAHLWDANNQVTLGTGARILGSGGTFAAVTAGHFLDIRSATVGTLHIVFTGLENTIGAFIAAIAASTPNITVSNVAGQIQITNNIVENRSWGTIQATSSADVLASLGLTAINFPTLPRLTALADNAGHGGTTANNLTGTVAYQEFDTNFLIWPSMQFRTADNLVSGTFTTIPQPFTLLLVARHAVASTAYLFDGLAADTMGVRFNAAQTQLQINAGGGYVNVATTTTNAAIYMIEVNGAATTVRISSDTITATVSPGANSLTGATIGQVGGGGAVAGADIAFAAVCAGKFALTQRQQFQQWASRRFGIALSSSAAPLVTFVTITSGQTITLASTDDADLDTSGGSLATGKLPAAPASGEKHSLRWIAGVIAPVVDGNGNQVESFASLGTFGSTTTINQLQQGGTVQYTGAHWEWR